MQIEVSLFKNKKSGEFFSKITGKKNAGVKTSQIYNTTELELIGTHLFDKPIDIPKAGLYRIFWKDSEGSSLASVGTDESGNAWFAPINWITVPCFDWKLVERYVEIKQRA